MKKIISALLALVIIMFSVCDSSFDLTANGAISERIIADANGIYNISVNGNIASANILLPKQKNAVINTAKPVVAASVFGDTFVALCNDTENSVLQVYTYDLNSGIQDSFAVNDITLGNNQVFCYDNGALYLADPARKNIIHCYIAYGLKSSYTMSYDVISLFCGYNSSGVYAVCDNRLYSLSSNGSHSFIASGIAVPVRFLSDSIAIDNKGAVYVMSSGAMTQIMTVEIDSIYSACIIGNMLYIASGSKLYRYDINKRVRTGYLNVSDKPSALYAYKGLVYTASGSSVMTYKPAEFVSYPTAPPSTQPTQTRYDEQQSSTGSNTTSSHDISSSAYKIDFSNYYISGINSPTTFAQFKSNIEYDGYTVTLYKGGKKVTSGNVGTGMKAVFEDNQSIYTFELAVTGDVTGEGNVNSRDIKELMDYMLGDINYNGVYMVASDMSGDGKIDIVDLAMLAMNT